MIWDHFGSPSYLTLNQLLQKSGEYDGGIQREL